MPFTGRLGTQNSELGNIVLGITDAFDISTFGFDVHVLTSDTVRVRFDHTVTDVTALSTAAYNLVSLASPSTAIVPTIERVTYYSPDSYTPDRKSVVLHLNQALTYNTQYSLQVLGVLDDQGEAAFGSAKNFTANVQDPPRVLGAYLSERGFVDILFDRPVGATSTATTASISGISGGPGVSMTLVAWTPFLPATTIRFQIPVGVPSDSGYQISLGNVVDWSLNANSETTGLGLVLRAPVPYSYAKLTQVQITDAYVADVSNDLINTATVRVYFNCNIDHNQSLNISNWTAAVHSGHQNLDSFDVVTLPAATDLPSLIALANDLKQKINIHETGIGIHYQDDIFNSISTPDAVDGPTSEALCLSIQAALLAHFVQPNVHAYLDTFNTFIPLPVFDVPTAITTINQIRIAFNGHLQSAYPTSFSTAYSGTPIGPISTFASVLSPTAQYVAPDTGPYNYYVDLHVVCPTNLVPIDVTAHIQSEDLSSITNNADYTGSVTARAANSLAQPISGYSLTDELFGVQLDRDINLSKSANIINLSTGVRIPCRTEKSATLAGLVWTLNNLTFAYSKHIDVVHGAGHQSPDTINIIHGANYLIVIDLLETIVAANILKGLINSHITNSTFHYNADNMIVTAPDAVDLESLIALIQNLRDVYLHHNASGDHAGIAGPPQFPGIHAYPGFRIYSARLFNLLKTYVNNIQDAAEYELSVPTISPYYDNALQLEFLRGSILTQDFTGIATRPSLASALPIIGFNILDPSDQLNYDSIQVFFSKPMYKASLDANLSLTGGSILVKDMSWTGDSIASIRVSNMTTISYSLSVSDLTDVGGNPVY